MSESTETELLLEERVKILEEKILALEARFGEFGVPPNKIWGYTSTGGVTVPTVVYNSSDNVFSFTGIVTQ